MGQAASKAKSFAKTADTAVKKAATQTPRPPPPQKTNSLGIVSTPKNPGGFLRGGGVASEDIRDIGQEMFLKSQHKEAPQEMPADLLKFITDVGPAKQSVDKEMTSSRLLESENTKELETLESKRQAPRQKLEMKLMDGLEEDSDAFSTIRNTNFSSRNIASDETDKSLGISNLQFYEAMLDKESKGDDIAVEIFFSAAVARKEDFTEDKSAQTENKKKLKQALQALSIPVLRLDNEGNIYGLYPDAVSGPEIKSMRPISPSKAKLVLQDVLEKNKTIERNNS